MSLKYPIIFLLSSLLSSFSYAQIVDSKISTSIIQGLKSNIPDLPKIDEVKVTPLPGIYEIKSAGMLLFYSSKDGNYLIKGPLVDLKNKVNLSQEQDTSRTVPSIDFKKLDLKDSFKIVKGNGKRKLAVFADPNCGFCKQLEVQLEEVKDVTIHLFLFPILGTDSVTKSNNIWCSKDPSKTWHDWMIKGINPPESKCKNTDAIAHNISFGKENKINGTPTLIFESGIKIPSLMSAVQIEEKLKPISKK